MHLKISVLKCFSWLAKKMQYLRNALAKTKEKEQQSARMQELSITSPLLKNCFLCIGLALSLMHSDVSPWPVFGGAPNGALWHILSYFHFEFLWWDPRLIRLSETRGLLFLVLCTRAHTHTHIKHIEALWVNNRGLPLSAHMLTLLLLPNSFRNARDLRRKSWHHLLQGRFR